ncbi:MAG: FtsX-like permease family protein [Alphaproteobacteria bacterium]|nr:MAG: FtsX-like permease family protein [Alphaproteobacteria bacterium]
MSVAQNVSRGITWRFALREMRGGLRGFAVFIACIALGVAAIAGVGSFARSLGDGLAREGRVILGGDVSFSLMAREASAPERTFLEDNGRLSVAATMRAMARAPDGQTALVEIKAVDGAYPLFGSVALEPADDLAAALEEKDGAFGAAVDPALLARLGIARGARVTIGAAAIELRAVLKVEPDRLAGGIGFGPRLIISEAALRATGLVQPGSLVRWHYRLRLPAADANDRAANAVVAASEKALPDAGWEVRTRANASPSLGRNIERFTQYLTLVGLTALLVGGVGVANAVKHYLDRRREVIATLKSLGATGSRVFAIYLTEVMLLAAIGTAVGLVVGAVLPFAISAAFGGAIPLPIEPALHARELSFAVLYGFLTALAFALWPLGRAHDVPVSALYRDAVAPERRVPRKRYVALTTLVVAALAGLAVLLAYDRRIAAIFVAAAACVFVVLRLIALLIMWAARRVPRPRFALLRLVLANIHRPGALTPSVVLSLGLGLALLVTLLQIDGNLRRQFVAALPAKAPSVFFVDIPDADVARFDAFAKQFAPDASYDRVPMLRGRIVAANGVRAEDLKAPPNAAWVLQSDRGITYAGEVPGGSRVVAGQWWGPDYQGPPLVSFENKIAEGLGLKIGDPVVVNVLGRNITATLANTRAVDWQSLGINFVLVYSPGAFRGAPHTHIATFTYPGGASVEQEVGLLKEAAAEFPTVTAVRVREALEAVAKVVLDLTFAIRGASAVTLIAAVLVLAGALATGHRHRVYDAVVLKMLGATRYRLLGAYALEYLLIGLATAIVGVAAGSLAALLVMTEVMNLAFTWLPLPAFAAALGASALTIVFGLIGTFSALGQKPAPVLRHL